MESLLDSLPDLPQVGSLSDLSDIEKHCPVTAIEFTPGSPEDKLDLELLSTPSPTVSESPFSFDASDLEQLEALLNSPDPSPVTPSQDHCSVEKQTQNPPELEEKTPDAPDSFCSSTDSAQEQDTQNDLLTPNPEPEYSSEDSTQEAPIFISTVGTASPKSTVQPMLPPHSTASCLPGTYTGPFYTTQGPSCPVSLLDLPTRQPSYPVSLLNIPVNPTPELISHLTQCQAWLQSPVQTKVQKRPNRHHYQKRPYPKALP